MTTPNLQLPEPPDFASPIAAEERDGQRALDALGPGWIAVLSGSTAAPPGDADQGDRYLIPVGATGAWATHARHVAYMTPIGWGYRAPRAGWVTLVLDEGDQGRAYQYNGTDWVRMTGDAFELAVLDALDITFDGYGLEGDPLTVDAALDVLFGIADDHETRITALEGGGGGGGGSDNVTADTHPVSAAALNDEFEAVSLDAKWNWRNQGGGSASLVGGSVVLVDPPVSAADNWRQIYQAIPSPNAAYDFAIKMAHETRGQYNYAGISLSVSGGKFLVHGIQHQNSTIAGYTNDTTYSGYLLGQADLASFLGATWAWKYYRVKFDGSSTWKFMVSHTGLKNDDMWFVFATADINSGFLGANPDRIGIAFQAYSATQPCTTAIDWFRDFT